MATTKLTSNDVCDILKSCAENGVSDLSFDGLKVTFKELNNVTQSIDFPVGQQEAVIQDLIEKDEVALKEEVLARMVVEDPVEYERLLMAGDFTDSKDLGDKTDEDDSGSE